MKNTTDTTNAYILNGTSVSFDVEGNIKSEYTSYKALLSSELNKISENFYDSNKQLTQETQYNENYAIAEEKHFKTDGNLDFTLLYKYDNNVLVEKSMILGSGNVHGKWLIAYDELNRIKEETWLNKDGEVEVTDVYTYSDDGHKISKKRSNLAEWLYTYDTDGRMTTKAGGYYSDDEALSIVYTYDENNIVNTEVTSYPTGQIKNKTTYVLAPKTGN